MKLITRRDRILVVAKAWKQQYPRPEPDKRRTQECLDALDLSTVHGDVVDEVIGNGSWTRLECNECGEDVQAVVEVGQPPDYESSTAQICGPCLKKASKLIRCGQWPKMRWLRW